MKTRGAQECLLPAASWPSIASQYALTRRQIDVAQLICKGRSSKSIAAEMRVSVNTARSHIRKLFERLGVNNRVTLVLVLLAAQRELAQASMSDES